MGRAANALATALVALILTASIKVPVGALSQPNPREQTQAEPPAAYGPPRDGENSENAPPSEGELPLYGELGFSGGPVELTVSEDTISFELSLSDLVGLLGKNPKSDSSGAEYDFGISFTYQEEDNGGFGIDIELSGSAGTSVGGSENEEEEEEEEGGAEVGVEGKLAISLSFDENGELVSYSVSGSIEVEVEIEIFDYTYFITFTIGPVPVWIEINVSGKVGFSLSASGTLLGEPKERANLSVKLYLGVELEALLYSALGGSGEVEPFVEAKYFVDEGLWVIFGGVTLSLAATIGVKKGPVDLQYTLWDSEWELSTPVVAFQRDAGEGGDAPEDWGNAREIESEKTVIGYLGRDCFTSMDDADLYRIYLKRTETLRLNLLTGSEHSDEVNFDLELYDNSENHLLVASSSNGGDEGDQIDYLVPADGCYYIKVKRASGGWSWGTYNLQVGVIRQNDMDSGGDASDNVFAALDLTSSLLPYTLTGPSGAYNAEFFGFDGNYLGVVDNSDFYKVFMLSAGHILQTNLGLSEESSDCDLYIYDPGLKLVARSTTPGSSTESLSVTTSSSGWYYVEVRRVSGTGNYSLEVTRMQHDVLEGDAPSDYTNARTLNLVSYAGGYQTGSYENCYLDEQDRSDVYSFSASQKDIISVKLVSPQDAVFWVYLMDMNWGYIASGKTVNVCAPYTGKYYLCIWRKSGRGIYGFTLETVSQNDLWIAGDAGDDATTSRAKGSCWDLPGWLGPGDEADFYSVTVPRGETLFVILYKGEPRSPYELIGSGKVKTRLEIQGFRGTVVSNDNVGLTRIFCGTNNSDSSNEVKVGIRRVEGSGYYHLSISVAPENDAGSGTDAGWIQGQEITLRAGENYRGYLDFCDTDDLYGVWLGMNDQLTVTMNPNYLDFDLYLYDATAVLRGENKVPFSSSTKTGRGIKETITYLAYHPGLYYIRVVNVESGSSGWYDLGLSVLSSPWPKEMHDVRNTSRGSYTGPDMPTLEWKYKIVDPTPDRLLFTPVIGLDDTIYVTLTSGPEAQLFAIDRYGALKWKRPVGLPCSAPLVGPDGTLYVLYIENGDRLGAFNPKDGSLRWSCKLGDFLADLRPLNVGPDGTIYVSTSLGVFAIGRDGNLKWTTNPSYIKNPYSPAVGTDRTIYVTACDTLFALNPENGGIKWGYPTNNSNFARKAVGSPIISPDGTIYYLMAEDWVTKRVLYAVNPNGTLKWSISFENTPGSQAPNLGLLGVDNDGTVYLAASRYLYSSRKRSLSFIAIRPSGVKKWELTLDKDLSVKMTINGNNPSPAIGSDNVIYFGVDKYLFAINKNGTLKWVYGAGDVASVGDVAGSLAIGRNKTLYFTCNDGYLYALATDLTPPSSTVTFPEQGSHLNSLTQIAGTASDYFSGVESVLVQIKRDSDGACLTSGGWSTRENAWLPTSFSKSDNTWYFPLSQSLLRSGEKYTIRSMAIDNCGNKENQKGSHSFVFDNTPPWCSVSINDGLESTRSQDVVLYLRYADESPLVAARYSNDGTSWSDWMGPSSTKSWHLSETGTIYYQVMDLAGNVSEPAFDSIIIEGEEPAPPEPVEPPENDNLPDWNPTFGWRIEKMLEGEAFLLEIEGQAGEAVYTFSTITGCMPYRERGGVKEKIAQKGEEEKEGEGGEALTFTYTPKSLPGLTAKRLSEVAQLLQEFRAGIGIFENLASSQREKLLSHAMAERGIPLQFRWRVSLLAPFHGVVASSEWRSFRLTLPENDNFDGEARVSVGAVSENELRLGLTFTNKGKLIEGGLGGVLVLPAEFELKDLESGELREIRKSIVTVGVLAPGETVSTYTDWTPPQGGSYEVSCEVGGSGVLKAPKRVESSTEVKTLPDLSLSSGDIGYEESLELLSITVRNTGNANSGSFRMIAYVDGTPVELGFNEVPAGGSTVATSSLRLSSGTHSIRVKADPDGLVEELNEGNNEASTVVTVSPNMPPEARFTYSPRSPTTETDVSFTDASTDSDGRIVKWYWSFGDGTSSSLQNPKHRYTSAGTYTVILTVADDRGNTGSCSRDLTVTSPPPPPPPAKTNTSLSITPSSFSLGPGKSLSLTATLRDGNGNPLSGKTVSWSTTAGNLSSQSGATNSYGQVTVTYTAPAVSVRIPVTVAASFSGDSSYNASSENASGAVLLTICIEGDGNFTVLNGVNGGGDGSAGNPYLIENWEIDASENHGIFIKNTSKHFVIRGCLVENGGSNYHGIHLENARNARVESSTVDNCHYGIYATESAGIVLRNNTFSSNAHSGIYLYFLGTLENVRLENNTCDNNYYGILADCDNLPNALVNNNRCRNNQSHGIYLKNSFNSTLENNICNNNSGYGIYLWLGAGDNLKNNICNNNSHGIYLKWSGKNRLENISARNNTSSGIRIQAGDEPADNNAIFNCTLENNQYGIYLYHSNNNLIENNTCDNNSLNGIILDYSDNNIVENNTCNYNTDPGIYLYRSSHNTLTRNTCNYNDDPGIKLSFSSNNNLDNNTCDHNSSGIDVSSSSFVSLINNKCRYNNNSGIILSESDNDNIDNNTIENNMYGLYIYNSSDNNKITNNRTENSGSFDIYLKNSTYNTLRANTYDNNKSYGIPAISGVSASPGPTTATITWITVNNSTSSVEYGIAPDNYELENSFEGDVKSHSVTLSGLSPKKTYSYRVKSTDENHNTEISPGYTFNTTGGVLQHGPIYICGDDKFTEANGVTSGSGTEDDPYIIENWVISASSDSGILIKDTTKHFVIRKVRVENAASGYYGIALENVKKGRVENSTVGYSDTGIHLYHSDNITLENNTVENLPGSIGIYLEQSNSCRLSGNRIENYGYGIYLYYSENSTLSGNSVKNNQYGIELDHSYNNTLHGNTLIGNTQPFSVLGDNTDHFVHDIDHTNTVDGKPIIYLVEENNIVINQDNLIGYLGLVNCENVLIENLLLENNGQGILLVSTKNGEIENVVCRNNDDGIYLLGCENLSLENNAVEYASNSGISLYYSDNCTLHNNNLLQGGGIYLWDSENCTISGNFMNKSTYTALSLDYSDNNNIENNTVTSGSDTGMSLYHSHGNTIKNNLVENCSNAGIHINHSDNSTLENNTVRNIKEEGIFQGESRHNAISGNHVENCEYGIYIYNITENTVVSGNTVENNLYGIYLDYARDVIISGNTVKNNLYGIRQSSTQSSNKTIYHNLIYHNTTNAYNTQWTSWDNGSEGNWWGDWQWENGLVDANNDGIFENNRLITGGGPYENGYDYHPLSLVNLKSPDNGSTVAPSPTLEWTTPCLENYTVEVDDDPNFGSKEYENTLTVKIENFSLQNIAVDKAMGLNQGKTYYWRVKAWEGSFYVYSPVWQFTTGTLPSRPSLCLPSNGKWTTDNTPYFEWENGSNASYHRLIVDNDPDFSSPEENQVVQNDNKYTVADENSLSNDTYYWKVVAVNDYGENESEVRVLDVLKERAPISINGDGGFTPENGVNGGGDGTPGNPYVIKNWVISASSAHGIEIKNTTAYFVVRKCLVENGRTNSKHGIYLYTAVNGRLENNILDNNFQGIQLYSSSNNILSGNTVENNQSTGIYLNSSDNNTLSGNTFDNNSERGISLYCSDNNNIWGNTVENSKHAIYLDYSDNNTLSGNTVENNSEHGIYLYYSYNNTLKNNTLNNNKYNFGVEGFSLSHFIHNIDHSNLISGKPIAYIVGENSIVINQDNVIGYLGLINVENVRVENLVMENNINGALLVNTKNSWIENLTCTNTQRGISLLYSNNNVLSGNTAEKTQYDGISLLYSNNNVLSGNTAKNCGYKGIYLNSSDNNTLSGNTFDNNSERGIYLYYSDNNNIWGNTVENSQYAIELDHSDNNTVYHNLLYNKANECYSKSNAWDNGSEGNWWGDWQWENGLVDANNDGIFENRRLITGSVYDNHPLSLVNLKSPDNGASVSSPVTLQWTAPALPVYVVQVDDNPNFSSVNYENTINVSIDSFDLSRTAETQATLGTGTWYWRVRVKDSKGRVVKVSPVRWFTVS